VLGEVLLRAGEGWHNEPGGWIRLRTVSSDGAAYLEIANSGPRISDGTVPSLFEPFGRVEAGSGVGDGVGLGLSIARSAVFCAIPDISGYRQRESISKFCLARPIKRLPPMIV
jgi:C4-dicarboxylate-specific signal transduction histidine kinase